MSDDSNDVYAGSSVRAPRRPPRPHRIWLLGFDEGRLKEAAEVIEASGHEARYSEPGSELSASMRDFRPDVIVIDMQDQPDRGRHAASQLRADRSTRQLPILLVGVAPAEKAKTDKAVTGPTRRYMRPLNARSVLNALVTDL